MPEIIRKTRNNQYLTRLLFYESATGVPLKERTITPGMSLYGGRDGLIDAKAEFVSLRDPSGYKWTQKFLEGDIRHWKKLLECSWFKEAYALWLEELETILKVEALDKIQEIAKTKSNQTFQAAKFLAQEGWKQKPESTRGRPSKEEISGELKKAVNVLTEVDEDINRIGGLKVITGGKIP